MMNEIEEVLWKLNSGNGIRVGAEPNRLCGLVVHHMPNRASTAFDIRDANNVFGLCIKADKAIRK